MSAAPALPLRGNRFVRFLLIGGVNTAFGYGVYALALFLGAHYAAATTASTVLGVAFNFVTTGSVVFGGLRGASPLRFAGVYAVTWAAGVLGLRAAHALGIDLYLAGFLLLLPCAALSFLLLRAFVFKEPR